MELIETYVEWQSLWFYRITSRYYIDCNGCTYTLFQSAAEDLNHKIQQGNFSNPMVAAEFVQTQLPNYQRA